MLLHPFDHSIALFLLGWIAGFGCECVFREHNCEASVQSNVSAKTVMRIDTGSLLAPRFSILIQHFKIVILSTDPCAAVEEEHNRKIARGAVRLENVGCDTILKWNRELSTRYARKRLMLLE